MLFDCFVFFNELDILELRLAELDPFVDRFVLVEASHTYAGSSKPLYFSENKHRFLPYINKIEHIIVSEFPNSSTPWDREILQRNAIMRGLSKCQEDDLVIIADVDEIPNGERLKHISPMTGARLKMTQHYYFLNLQMKGDWTAVRVVPYKELTKYSAHQLRVDGQSIPLLEEGGWHFSYLGGPSAIRAKMRAYSHQEYNCESYLEEDRLQDLVRSGRDIVGRKVDSHLIPISRLPRGVNLNAEKYQPFMIDHLDRFDRINNEKAEVLNKIERVILNCAPQNGGAILDLGAGSGEVSIVLANAVYPNLVFAVDEWNTEDEGFFRSRIRRYTHGNIVVMRNAPADFIQEYKLPIRFCHFGASFNPVNLRDNLARARHLLLPSGKLCWHDQSAKSISSKSLRQTFGDGGKSRQEGILWEYSP